MASEIDLFTPRKYQRRQESKFRVYMNDGEMRRIHEWVMQYPEIQTGCG